MMVVAFPTAPGVLTLVIIFTKMSIRLIRSHQRTVCFPVDLLCVDSMNQIARI